MSHVSTWNNNLSDVAEESEKFYTTFQKNSLL